MPWPQQRFAHAAGVAGCRTIHRRGVAIELFALWKLQRVTKNGAHGPRSVGAASIDEFIPDVGLILLWTRRKHTPLKRSRIESVPLLKVIVNVVGDVPRLRYMTPQKLAELVCYCTFDVN